MDKEELNKKSYEFYLNLKKKYDNLKIAYKYSTIRIYINDYKTKTKTLYYILNENGDIVKNLKYKNAIGNIYKL
jgi:hypothetical protein